MLAIPAVAFLVVAGVGAMSLVSGAHELDDLSRHVAFCRPVTGLVHELQRERDRTEGYLVVAARGDVSAPAAKPLAEALSSDRRAVNRAVAAYLKASRTVNDIEPLRGKIGAASRAVERLDDLRDAAGSSWLRRQAIVDEYTEIIDTLLDIIDAADVSGSEEGAQGPRVLASYARAKDLDGQVRGRLYGLAYSGGFAVGEFQSLATLLAERSAALEQFRAEAGPGPATLHENLVGGQATLAAARIERAAVERSQRVGLGVDPEQWWAASSTEIELVRKVESQLLADVASTVERSSTEEWQQTLLAIAGIVLILVVALMASLAVGRMMIGSLGRLRGQALNVAYNRLPDVVRTLRAQPRAQAVPLPPTQATSRDEIGEVAEAFDAVQRAAVRLAIDQAQLRGTVSAMFVNLARRSQTLVGRQLELLDQLEERERDPSQMESLFKLDHLATRLRRNDASLLVVANADTGRISNEPIALDQVFLAAIAEIESYTRIRHDPTEGIYVVGNLVGDLVHMLAELLDNATTFSAPTTVVHISWRRVAQGLQVSVEDGGMGMPPERRADLNTRLAHPPDVDVGVSERMGLYVVGRLAARHRIFVQLDESDAGGVTATVRLPDEAVVTQPEGADTGPTPVRGQRQAPVPPPGQRPAPSLGAQPSLGGQPGAGVQPLVPAGPGLSVRIRSEDLLPNLRSLPGEGWDWFAKRGSSRQTALGRVTVDETIAESGLPRRIPGANVPVHPLSGQKLGERPVAVLEPDEASSVMSSFFGGTRRADAEEEDTWAPFR